MTRPRSLGIGRRLKYFFWRASNLRVGNLFHIAGNISRKSGKPMLLVAIDMVWSAAVHETGFTDYQDWDFHLLKHSDRITYLTHPKSNHIAQLVNQMEFRYRFADKSEFNRGFGQYIGREWLDVREATTGALRAFLQKHRSVMVKVIDSDGGQGIERREASDIDDYDAFRAALLEKHQFLVEQIIPQHPTMSSLNPTSVNSLRMISYFDGTDVHLLARVLKMGNGDVIDNFAHGGMYTMLDEHGVALHGAFDISGEVFDVHPLTGISITGFAVPLYDKVLDLVDEVARVVPQIPYVGWDIAISPDRPVVIEGNYNTGVFQSKPSLTNVKTGLLPLYKEVIGF